MNEHNLKKIIITVSVITVLVLLWVFFGKGLLSKYYEFQIRGALSAGDSTRAVTIVEKQLGLSPDDDAMRMKLVNMLLELGIESRAEYYLLTGIEKASQPIPFYEKLSAVYVAQDKLYDAVELLNNVRSPRILSEVSALRPAAPVFSPESGSYDRQISVSVEVPEGSVCYVSWVDEVPSVRTDKYEEPVMLGPGVTKVRAVTVNGKGVVSGWSQAEYILEGISLPVEFEDPAIERLTRAILQKPDGHLMSDEISKITALVSDTASKYVTLSDLEKFTGLETLSLVGADENTDISALPLVGSLQNLKLDNFHIDSIGLEPIGQMIWLKSLSLPHNRIASIAPLEGLTLLKSLDLSDNSLLSVAALGKLTALTDIRLSKNAIDDLTPLKDLKSLKTIDLSENRISTLNGLYAGELETLIINNNCLENAAALRGAGKLKVLMAGNNVLGGVEDLASLTALEELSLPYNQLTEVGELKDLVNLSVLDITGNQITTLGGLSGCVSLKTLYAPKNRLPGIASIGGHPALEKVYLENNSIDTLLPLKQCPKLKEIHALFNPIKDSADAFAGTGITVYRS